MLKTKIEFYLKSIYGETYSESQTEQIMALLNRYEKTKPAVSSRPDAKTAYLITYGDSISEAAATPLATLNKFLQEQVGQAITDVHLLPMFPYTSDDGFSVTDYRAIDPKLGSWDDISTLSADYRLMFDFVANHVSKSSVWFQKYLAGEQPYTEYFIKCDPNFDASVVVRPRTSPLFHEYNGNNGKTTAWTTFSEDQVDVNFGSFPLLLEMCDILLDYLHRGGTSIRLDAIGFIWKQSATTCLHLPQAHAIVKLWRAITEHFNRGAQLITETNVPHPENISYYGDGNDEAHMVYQFALPPLVLHTLSTHAATKLSSWAQTISRVSDSATWFNFLASHDGIGMRPSEGILTDAERQYLVDKVVENGGKISFKNNPDGSQTVYELNINYFDALINKAEDRDMEQQCRKFLAAQFILLSMIGVPAIYIHSLLGSRNDYEGLTQSGINRRINREKLEYSKLVGQIAVDYTRKTIFETLKQLLTKRSEQPAFSPYGTQIVIDCGADFFVLKRVSENETVICIVNVCAESRKIPAGIRGYDIISDNYCGQNFVLAGYQYLWLK
ncbi:MAG: sugar phosphorylase [Negativicutes bacterium]|jgi:sucrose phosphorylase